MCARRCQTNNKACDCCSVRRVKCDGRSPCARCETANIECTYLRIPKKRGPKSMRQRSIDKITTTKQQLQQERQQYEQNFSQQSPQEEQQLLESDHNITREGRSTGSSSTIEGICYNHVNSSLNSNCFFLSGSERLPESVIDQCLVLYSDNLYKAWPLMQLGALRKILHTSATFKSTAYFFLVALCAATLADLQTNLTFRHNDNKTQSSYVLKAEDLAWMCVNQRAAYDDLNSPDLYGVMLYYCLHRCFARNTDLLNITLRCCSSAITMAHICNLQEERTYSKFSLEEQQIRRRVFYLLLITERYYSIMANYPITFDANVQIPDAGTEDEPESSLTSFLALIRIFTIPEKSFFEEIRHESNDFYLNSPSLDPSVFSIKPGTTDMILNPHLDDILSARDCDRPLWCGKLSASHTIPSMLAALNVEQEKIGLFFAGNVDRSISIHWMKILIWKLALKRSKIVSKCASSSEKSMVPMNMQSFVQILQKNSGVNFDLPASLIKDLLCDVLLMPREEVKIYGPGFEEKLFDIANTVADCLIFREEKDSTTLSVLRDLSGFISSLHPKNKMRLSKFSTKMQDVCAAVRDPIAFFSPFSGSAAHIDDRGYQEKDEKDQSRQSQSSCTGQPRSSQNSIQENELFDQSQAIFSNWQTFED
ncbi:LAMI_0B00144g1_1 [Lachancea mirantina]|uniref:LAMI_0B00144g1_1 n=1 Tax=Lachancea mirantina TaxID=1230905 RepID=A0A1G4ISW4_9SACH|nr:LAMI_0B00144g1_1 [Lachancea mirantina]